MTRQRDDPPVEHRVFFLVTIIARVAREIAGLTLFESVYAFL
jgi:hypothetical protein